MMFGLKKLFLLYDDNIYLFKRKNIHFLNNLHDMTHLLFTIPAFYNIGLLQHRPLILYNIACCQDITTY